MPDELTAEQFIHELEAQHSPQELEKIQGYLQGSEGESLDVIGVRMGQIFTLAKDFIEMPLDEIEKLLQSNFYEARAGALSIMGKQAERKKTPESHRQALYDLFLKHTDKINLWQILDISCHKVIGGYLLDKPRDKLYELARSENWWERRIAVYSTLMFIRVGDLDDAFQIAELLIHDEEHFIHTAVGGVLREAGKQDRNRLLSILDEHAATMPRIALRYAIEHLAEDQRKHYLKLKKEE